MSQDPPAIPPSVEKIWRNFVRQEARRGQGHISGLVSLFVEVLVNRSVAEAAPDPEINNTWEARRSLWVAEIGRIDQALAAAAAAPSLVVPFAPLAPHELPASEPPLAADVLSTAAALSAYRAQVAARLSICVDQLVGQSNRREKFAGQRLQAAHRVSAWAPILHSMGAEELALVAAEQQAQRGGREVGEGGADLDPDAPPPPPVTYRQLGETILRRLADAGDQVAERLPSRFRRAADAMVARLRPSGPMSDSDRPPPPPPERAPKA